MLGVVWVIGLALFGHMCGTLGANIALGGKVSQSSQYNDGRPQKAVDGSRANHGEKFCTHTQRTRDPWWRLDLGQIYSINTVTITNRGDGSSERLNGAEIRIGVILDARGSPRCAQITSIAAGATQSFECKGMSGRYVGVVIPGREEYLTLCEVEVDGSPAVNIALRGIVSQSSVYGNAVPQRVVDGNRASNWGANSCACTQKNRDPWWRVDLGQTYIINTVVITNRGDTSFVRLNGAEIRIGDSLDGNGNSNPRCAVIASIPAGETRSLFCNGMKGRYINVVIRRVEFLTMCELEAYGTLPDDDGDKNECGVM